jgi:protein TonB
MRSRRSLTVPLSFSLVLHAAAVVGLMQFTAAKHHALPRVYNVTLVAAPAGPRAVGVVDAPKPAPEKAAPPKARTKSPAPTTKAAPAKKTTQATANVPAPVTPPARTPEQPKAGGGATGGKGSDAATVKIESGFDFPYQGYLDNIVNQIAKNFYSGGGAPKGQLRATVTFLIHRDGSVSSIRITEQSVSYDFNLEAKGAVEAVGKVRGFGPLPAGFADDVLPVVFSFDPRIIR